MFTVPAGVTSVDVTAVGGHGGSAATTGGAAARVSGALSVTPGETLYVEVGGIGSNGNPDGGGVAAGGFNGGAPGGAGGGGASDIRTSPLAEGLSSDSRLLVAGGGGGSGQNAGCKGGAGGAAEQEGEAGSCSNGGGGAGTQTSGGAGGTVGCGEGEAGQLGQGGEGGGNGFHDESCNDRGGGGGGGLYGGGGGCGAESASSGGGGGGSSLVPGGGTVTLASPMAAPEVQITYVSSSPPPTVTTELATTVTQKSATLNATVDPEGNQVTACTFEYGTTTAYGSSVACATLPGAGTSPVAVSAAISGLKPTTMYHFRISATNEGGTSEGDDLSFTTAPPQEELPEIGRCLKLKRPTGKYQNAGCTTRSAGEDSGSYEWAFEPGSASSFTFKNGAATLETVGGTQVKCLSNTFAGEYTGSKTALVNLKLTGCEPANRIGIKCQSQGGQTGEVDFNTLEGNLGYIADGVEPTVGMALTPTTAEAPYVTQFHCGEVPISITGGVIVPYTAVNKMAATFSVAFKASKGKQSPEALEGGSPLLLSMTIGESTPAQAALKAQDKVTNQEKLEIKAST
ncbi:MAG TPA: fibronectin type III domain-containing protein [Solirubrobacteraceae bacterium]